MDLKKLLKEKQFYFDRQDGSATIYKHKLSEKNTYLKIFKSGFTIDHERELPNKEFIEKKIKEEEQKNKKNMIHSVVNIIEWLLECYQEEDSEFDENSEDDEGKDFDIEAYLPKIKVNKKRKLKIIVWGKSRRDVCPAHYESEHSFNAAVLHSKKKGVDWRKDGRDPEVRKAVMRGREFPRFLQYVLETIESKDLSVCDIFCRKGRHRSFSTACVLSEFYYSDTEIVPLEI
jgi:hypothetical protein